MLAMQNREIVERRRLDERRATDAMDMLKPSVEHVRRELFGSPERPFTSADRAAAWIRKEAAKENLPPADPKLEEQLVRLAKHVKELSRRTGSRLHLHVENPVLRYLPPGCREPDTVRVVPGSPLDRLAAAARVMAEATGYPEEAVVALVLYGRERPHPVMRVERRIVAATLPDGTLHDRHEAVLRIFEPRIPPARWREVRETLARGWGELLPSGLDDLDRTILEIVRERGGLDEKHPWSLKYWNAVAEELRRRGVRHSRDDYYRDGYGPLNRVRGRRALRAALGLLEG